MNNPTIQAIDLSKKYGSFEALANLNLKIEGSKCVGFLGPNGAGKTTTLKLFTDLIHSTSGQALINGVDVHLSKKKALATTSALIETPEIYPSLTPREAMKLVGETRGVPKDMLNKKVEEALHEVRMDEWIDKRVGKFSKGMKQRVAVASTLLNDPEIILLDEPTTGLDPRGMSEVREIIKGLKDRKRLIFMSSHLLAEVTDVCDEVAMIDHGKLLAYDSIHNLTRKFSGGGGVVDIGFLAPVDDERTMTAIRGVPGVESAEKLDSRNVRVMFKGGLDLQARLLYELASLQLGMISFRASASALEGVYLNLIKETL